MSRAYGLFPLVLQLAACAAAAATDAPSAGPKTLPSVVILPSAAPPSSAAPPAPNEGPPLQEASVVPEAERIDTAGRSLPNAFALDGTLTEWGVLAVPPEPELDPATKQPGPRKAAAPNRLALALQPTRAVLAGELTGDLAKGVFIALRFENDELPPVGMYQRGGGIREFQCEINESSGEELSGPEKASCEAMLAGIAQFQVDYAARFTRVYRVDAEGVRSVGPGGLQAIESAEARWLAGDGKATFELSLPLVALPRCAASPVTFASLAALPGAAERPAATIPNERFVATSFEPGVSFEPDAAVRDMAFWIQQNSPWYAYRPALSYQPGEENRIETVVYPGTFDRSFLSLEPVPLFSIAHKKGDLEVLFVQGGRTAVVVRRAGKLSETPVEMSRTPDVVVPRGKDLHVLSASSSIATDTWTESADFEAVAIHPDGSQDAVEIRDPQELSTLMFSSVNVVHDATWSSFGFVGQTRVFEGVEPPQKPRRAVVTYTWSAREKAYIGRLR